MTTARRSPLALAAYSIATAALAATAFALTAMSEAPRAHLTDDRVIDVPLEGAPAREVLWTPATPVEGAVNSAVDEYEPRISGDGTTMVFVRRRPGSNADLFAARWTPSGWSEPEPIEAMNSDADELGPELSRDGTRLYFYSDREGGLGGYDLWRSERASATDSWPAPTNLGPAINTAANEYGPGLTPDGERLYFATNRPRPDEPQATGGDAWTATLRERRTRHDYDLYAAARSDEGWSQATRVEAVSSAADDGSPAVSPAGDFLYFASDREGGTGGYDLYRVRLAPDGAVQSPTR
jgi:Tol biopolymer transport system component